MLEPYHPSNCRCLRCAATQELLASANPKRGLNFSARELWALTRGLLGITVALTIFLAVRPQLSRGGFNLDTLSGLDVGVLVVSFLLALAVVGSGFVLHELAHKFVAQRYGFHAEFKAFNGMILLAIVMALFLPIIFVAPGAVVVSAWSIDKRRNGLISASGPAVNLVLGTLFGLLFWLVAVFDLGSIWRLVAFYGIFVNGWLALFNLVPLFVLDGAKVMAWNRVIWLVMILLAATMFLTALFWL